MTENITRADAATATQTHAEEMVAKLQADILAGAGGVVTTSVDGTSVTVSRSQMLEELRYWQRVVARQNGTRPTSARIRLG